jgi:hypothetical protein
MNDVDDDLIGLEVGRFGRGLFWFLRHADEGGVILIAGHELEGGSLLLRRPWRLRLPFYFRFRFRFRSRLGLGRVGLGIM